MNYLSTEFPAHTLYLSASQFLMELFKNKKVDVLGTHGTYDELTFVM